MRYSVFMFFILNKAFAKRFYQTCSLFFLSALDFSEIFFAFNFLPLRVLIVTKVTWLASLVRVTVRSPNLRNVERGLGLTFNRSCKLGLFIESRRLSRSARIKCSLCPLERADSRRPALTWRDISNLSRWTERQRYVSWLDGPRKLLLESAENFLGKKLEMKSHNFWKIDRFRRMLKMRKDAGKKGPGLI